jgi:2-polyprenyl-6-methoxyphenol hydroxylase-like FAD-dependent oxidoreductase
MTDTPITDVLIVGGGPVGLTLACDLVRRGIACRIIDQEATYHTGRAAGLSPRTQEIFEDLGLLEQITASNASIPWRFYDRDNRLVREIDPASNPLPVTPDVPYPGTLHVGQQEIEAVLRSSLASSGRHVELDCQLVDFIQHPDHVVAKVVHAGAKRSRSGIWWAATEDIARCAKLRTFPSRAKPSQTPTPLQASSRSAG